MGASLLFAGWFKEFCSSGPCRKALVLLLKNALERVFVLGSKRKDIRHFLLGFFARVGAANSFSLIVDAIHLRNGFVVGHPKETFQHTNDESIGVRSSFNSDTSKRGKFGICGGS